MTEYNKIRLADFYFKYFLVLAFFTSVFYWFQGDLISWGRLLVLLILPLPIVWRNKRKPEKKLPTSHFEVLGIVGALVLPGTFEQGFHANVVICSCFCLASVFLCFLNKYLRGRYIVLYCNPSVSEETKRRAGHYQRRPLAGLVIMGSAVLFLVVVVWLFMPEMQRKPSERMNREQQEQDNIVEEKSNKVKEDIQEKMKEEQEKATNNLWLQLLRYVVTFAVVAGGVLVIVYVLFRLVLFVLGRGRKIFYDYQEQVEKKTEWEEITRLVPVVKHHLEFSDGWDGKVRKAFYRTVKKGAGVQGVNVSLTPEELHKEYLSMSNRDELLTRLYEKARYADESVKEEEWKQWEEVRKS